jgi:hypothetical protein
MTQSALRIETRILPGNKLEILLPEDCASGVVGETIEVIVLLPEMAIKRRSAIDIINEVRSQRSPRSVEDINRELQMERDAWDS